MLCFLLLFLQFIKGEDQCSVVMDFKYIFFVFFIKQMIRIEKFVQWFCFMFYCLGGVIFFLLLQIVGIVFMLDLVGYFDGYFCLLGFVVIEIGFIFIILVCLYCRGFCYVIILILVVDCLVWVNFILLMLVEKGLFLFRFFLFWMVFNFIFVLVIVVIWSQEMKDVFVSKFL